MNRRLFIRALSAGLVLPVLPVPLSAAALSPEQAALAKPLRGAANLIQNQRLGDIQRLAISRIYSPGRTPPSTLADLAAQDANLIGYLTGKKPNAGLTANARTAPAPFGSFSNHFDVARTSVTWQHLARVGTPPKAPLGSVCITGSRGAMHIDLGTFAFTAVNFRGRSL